MPPNNLPNLSGQPAWQPAAAEWILEAYSRISEPGMQFRGQAIQPEHLIEARRSANIILSRYANRGINLWLVPGADPDICIGLTPGQKTYPLPIDTADMLDSYLRYYTPGTTSQNIGNALTALTDFAGNPTIATPYGDITLTSPASGTLSATAGSQWIQLTWPSHGLVPGSPIFWGCPVSVGGITLPYFSVVSSVIDPNNVSILSPLRALESQTLQGITPFYQATSGSATVNVFLPGHGQSVGDIWNIAIPVTVGGLTLSGNYTVASVIPAGTGYGSYEFTISAGSNASSSAGVFQNGGQLPITLEDVGIPWTDVFLWPISRNDYAALPLKNAEGSPTSYWFSKLVPPELTVWPVTPVLGSAPLASGPWLAFCGYRMREPEVFNPGSGQTVDVPRRFYEAFVSELTARLAEKYNPKRLAEKAALAKDAWMEASEADTERVSFRVVPNLRGYFS